MVFDTIGTQWLPTKSYQCPTQGRPSQIAHGIHWRPKPHHLNLDQFTPRVKPLIKTRRASPPLQKIPPLTAVGSQRPDRSHTDFLFLNNPLDLIQIALPNKLHQSKRYSTKKKKKKKKKQSPNPCSVYSAPLPNNSSLPSPPELHNSLELNYPPPSLLQPVL